MAAVSIPPSPHAIGNMASRRAPLSAIPNAANSPFRVTAASMKRPRSQSNTNPDAPYGQPPPLKKKIVEADESTPSTPRKRTGQALLDQVASRAERVGATRTTRQTKPQENSESLRQWQSFYRKAFPGFVFYFDNVPEDSKRQFLNSIQALGARQEKFFSKDVTHVITTRPVPADSEQSLQEVSHALASRDVAQPRTINPSLLERSAEQNASVPKSKFTFDQPIPKRLPTVGHDLEARKQPMGQVDMLQRAKEMHMKIWQVEKLQRILIVMLDDPTSPHDVDAKSRASRVAQGPKLTRQPDLSQLIKNEQLNGPAEKEANIITFDLVPFKGYHIYIRDMNEKTKPILARDYPKVQVREDGEWPQFRSASKGKCPFVEEDPQSQRHAEKERERAREEARRQKAAVSAAPRTRASTAAPRMEPPPYAGRKRPLHEVDHNVNAVKQEPQQLPDTIVDHGGFTKPPPAGLNGPFQAHGNGSREPMASGLQASNITSAIRSQMISSTAAAPGAKAGTSKEIHGLQRKVLERNSGPAVATLAPSRRMTDIAGAARANPRAAKQKAQERMGGARLTQIHEDTPSEDDNELKQPPRPNVSRVLKKEKRDPKPGYCENCREKFEDFDEHTFSKRHRRFATSKDNWKELDSLLSVLGRPLRDDTSEMSG